MKQKDIKTRDKLKEERYKLLSRKKREEEDKI